MVLVRCHLVGHLRVAIRLQELGQLTKLTLRNG